MAMAGRQPPTGGRMEPLQEAGALCSSSRVANRGIRMKFAVLHSLVEDGQVSKRDIVETVLNLVRRTF
uniref:Uncharacterized protein n=1 Tax=Paramormyrops kingsleyae TaxID=1676925 RepID=A0A3B3SW24_9TELE